MTSAVSVMTPRRFYSPDDFPDPPESALPAEGLDALALFGVRLGKRVHQARLLRRVELPAGWYGEGNEYGVWQVVRDQHDRRRALVCWFGPSFKADASGQMVGWCTTVVSDPRSYVSHCVDHGHLLVLDTRWATRAVAFEVADAHIARLSQCHWEKELSTFGDQLFAGSSYAYRAEQDRIRLRRWQEFRDRIDSLDEQEH